MILVTLSGIVTEVKAMQLTNAAFPMLVTLFGIVTDSKLLQPLNAFISMLVTLLGMVTDLIVLPSNANPQIDVTVFGISTFVALPI